MPRDPVTIVCWWWKSRYYSPADVLRLTDMVERHYPAPHKFLCMTNAPEDLDGGIDTAIIPQEYLDWGYHYVKLFAFSKEGSEIAGHRALFLDLNVTLLGNIAPLLAGMKTFAY